MNIPELIFKFGDADPAVLFVRGLANREPDYLFTHVFCYTSDMKCAGSADVEVLTLLPLQGGNIGYKPDDLIKIGAYDSLSGMFYALSGRWYNNYSGYEVFNPTWESNGFLELNEIVVGAEIFLVTDPDLVAVTVTFDTKSPILLGATNEMFFNITSKNVDNLVVKIMGGVITKSGVGYLFETKRYYYKYTVPQGVNTVVINVDGKNAFTASAVNKAHTVSVEWAAAPPVGGGDAYLTRPELVYQFGDADPAFVIIRGLYGLEFSDSVDSVFAYTDGMLCAGMIPITGNAVALVAHGGASGKGYRPDDDLKIGVFDSQTEMFYALAGTWINKLTGDVTVNPKWAPMAFYELIGVEVVGAITLATDPDLVEVKIEFDSVPVLYVPAQSDTLYFNVTPKNVTNLEVKALMGTVEGKGVQWYLFNQQWYHWKHKVPANAETVSLVATGENAFTGAPITQLYTVTIERPANPDATVVFTNQYFSVVTIGTQVYLQAESSTAVYVNFTYNGNTVNVYVAHANVKKGDKTLMGAIATTKINYAMYKGIGGLPKNEWSPKYQINQTIIS